MTDDAGNGSSEGVERRKFIKGAATVAWATPMILSMGAGTASAQSAPCTAVGSPCNACTGIPCCDNDGVPDGGCCCSPPDVPRCEGLCVNADADCATPAPLTEVLPLLCYVPAPPP